MRLSDIRRQTNSGQGGTAIENVPVGTIRNAVAYPYPINAIYRLTGRPVTLVVSGEVDGLSPAEKFVDEDGRMDWASSEDFLVDDRHVLPRPSGLNQTRGQGPTAGSNR